MDWFLYDNGLRHERVKLKLIIILLHFLVHPSEVLERVHQIMNELTLPHHPYVRTPPLIEE